MPRGGARPGAGRPRKAAAAAGGGQVLPFERPAPAGRSVTLGEALAALKPAPATASPDPPGGAHAAAPAPVPAPGAPATAQAGTGWCAYAGHLGSGLFVVVAADHLKARGFKPNDPDDADVERLQRAIETGLRESFGDAVVPWWAAIGLAGAGVYATMRIGAKRLKAKPKTKQAMLDEAAAALPSSGPTPPAAPTKPAKPDPEPEPPARTSAAPHARRSPVYVPLGRVRPTT